MDLKGEAERRPVNKGPVRPLLPTGGGGCDRETIGFLNSQVLVTRTSSWGGMVMRKCGWRDVERGWGRRKWGGK